jgi:hypothetical protein
VYCHASRSEHIANLEAWLTSNQYCTSFHES